MTNKLQLQNYKKQTSIQNSRKFWNFDFWYCLLFVICGLLIVIFQGCQTTQGNKGNIPTYSFQGLEAEWIRGGEPIEFEGKRWYPVDGVEMLLDSEVLKVATYKEVEVFIDKVDVRPYNRLYTKFSKNQFRYWKQKK